MWLAIGLSVILVLGLWGLTDRTIRSSAEASLEEAVDVDLAGLVDIYASGGQDELIRRIEDRMAFTPSVRSAPHYLLADGSGQRLTGDLARWPPLDPKVSENGRFETADGTGVLGRATQLSPQLRLVVAYETGQADPLLRRVALVFLACGILFVALVAFFGWRAADRLQTRIGAINRAFRSPDKTALAERTLADGAGDEIDELTRHSAAALNRVHRLLEVHRDTTDNLAHEIRTPLMHLDQKLVKALSQAPEPAVAQGLLEARGEIRRIVGTLESLLDIAASKARRGDPHGLETLDLSTIVERICELYADSAEESGHAFTWQIEPGVTLDGEASQIGRIVTNLLDNAFKYVPQGGLVHLSLKAGPVLTVEDDGPGIPADQRERVFERFARAEPAAGGPPGSGLGLALARAIAERHGLAIMIADSDKGARFVIRGEES